MNWRFLPFKSLCQQNGKATRKKLDLNLKNFNYFPPEGHTYVDISHTDKEIASTSDEVTVKSYLFFGGSRRTNETAWGYGKEFFLMKFSVEDTDINLISSDKCTTQGSEFPPLHASAACFMQNNVFIWGGMNTSTMKTTDELFIVNSQARGDKELSNRLKISLIQSSTTHSPLSQKLSMQQY